MRKFNFMKRKEIKNFLKDIKEYYGVEFSKDYLFILRDSKIYICSKEFLNLDTKNVNINTLGLYFCKIEKDGIRLSIEGSQILKPKKNIIEINEEESRKWLSGSDLEISKELKGFLVVKSNKDFIGTGKAKEGKLLNYIPKYRRITSKVQVFD